MRILAIDLGQKRSGLALSDALGLTTRPLAVLTASPQALVKLLLPILREEAVEQILVGWALRLDGSLGEAAERQQAWAEKLEKNLRAQGLTIPVLLWNESLTTDAARARLREQGGRKKTLDAVAAQILLEDYLAERQSQRGQEAPEAN